MRIIVSTSSFPAHPEDHVPTFVLDQVIALAKYSDTLSIHVLIPHNSYNPPMPDFVEKETHIEVRFHYFYPHSAEKLSGRGILPALRENPLRYFLVPFFLAAQRRALSRLCRTISPDVVYAHWFMPQAFVASGVCRRLGIPLVFTTHASDVSILARVPFAKRLIARVLRQSHSFTAVSRRTAEKLTRFFGQAEWNTQFAAKLSIIPMGIDLDRVPSRDKEVSKGTAKMILTLGRLSEKKGIKYLIDAYSLLPIEMRESYQLVIAGDGQLMNDLKTQAINSPARDSIFFAGYVSGDAKYALLEDADIFVLPSIIDDIGDSEGLPVALMEALSFGKLIVATNVSGAEEVLTDTCGRLVTQKSSNELSDALRDVIELGSEDREREKQEARELALQFGWPNIAKQHFDVIAAAASGGG